MNINDLTVLQILRDSDLGAVTLDAIERVARAVDLIDCGVSLLLPLCVIRGRQIVISKEDIIDLELFVVGVPLLARLNLLRNVQIVLVGHDLVDSPTVRVGRRRAIIGVIQVRVVVETNLGLVIAQTIGDDAVSNGVITSQKVERLLIAAST